ncbi:hypothetical protein [Modestobacter roseus]|uniref:Anti-anti-sigma factor n=1 Tax=Modestobacter roseus TaxID=1181884 RepID=A0A562INC8_9ACTN|nr:hypothetical protein [Modestobacter roseus]MQA34208.1 hypothetical protein [Modestobacter roseus]TWH72529.1 hypothetical protein JD78_01045 [Modestobacter roseus]
MADGISVRVHQHGDVVVLVAHGDVRDDQESLRRLVGVALMALDDRPAVLDVCDLYVHRREGLEALRWLIRQRPPGARTVVLARTTMRRHMVGVFGRDVAWYPAEVQTPWVGVAASLSHHRRHLPAAQRSELDLEQLVPLLWAAAEQRATARVRPTSGEV